MIAKTSVIRISAYPLLISVVPEDVASIEDTNVFVDSDGETIFLDENGQPFRDN